MLTHLIEADEIKRRQHVV